MEKRKVFCEECRDDVEFGIVEKEMEGRITGESYLYVGKEAHCMKCNSKLYVAEIQDHNLSVLYHIYRKKYGIIALDVILEIPEKYAIAHQALSLLLGWGEQTFSRYCEGDIPTKQNSEILQKIYAEPHYYAEILEHNKASLRTDTAYHKSKKAVDLLISLRQNTKSMIDLVTEYLQSQCEDITPLAMQKALYYTQGFYYAFYHIYLFAEECEAWIYGPVYPMIYSKYQDYHFEPIRRNNKFDDSVFSAAEKAILDSIIRNICCYSGKILETFTHSEAPWLAARGELSAAEASNRIIRKEWIGAYFRSVKDTYGMINPNDIKGYAQKMFQQM